jgi:DNA-binding IclR family transcriptional regulator
MSKPNNEGTASLDKALDVLDAVGGAASGLSQVDLGQRLGLPRTTLYRLLGTLVARGLLRRDPQRRVYCLGSRCFEYARAAYAMPDLMAAASSELRALRDMSGETTYLAALDGHEVVSLDRCDGPHALRSHSAVGQRKPLHCTSQGKAILSALPPERRDALVREIALPALTPRTVTDRRRFLAEIEARGATRLGHRRRGDHRRGALLRRADRRQPRRGARRDQHRGPRLPADHRAPRAARPRAGRGGAPHRRPTLGGTTGAQRW